MSDLELAFHRAMLGVYGRAKAEAGYTAVKFLQMVSANGGLATAKTLLRSRTPSVGYTALWERGQLDLSVEALVLQDEWRPLFTDPERALAEKRLRAYGWSPPA